MKEFIFVPFLTGLSTGIYCLSYCFPFLVPLILSEDRKKKENLTLLVKFIGGRFFGYITFGAFFGYLGEKINISVFNFISLLAMTFLSLLLILHSLSFFKKESFFCKKFYLKRKNTPFFFGFLTGVNICPPFVISLTYVFNLHYFIGGIVYFSIFFLATTLYIFPLFFVGFLNKMEEFRKVGRISGLIVGLLFLSYGLYHILKGSWFLHFEIL